MWDAFAAQPAHAVEQFPSHRNRSARVGSYLIGLLRWFYDLPIDADQIFTQQYEIVSPQH